MYDDVKTVDIVDVCRWMAEIDPDGLMANESIQPNPQKVADQING